MDSAGVKRCFIAIPIDDVTRADLVDATQHLKQFDGLRLTAPDNLHLTAKFLGDVPDSQIEDVLEAMELAVEGISRFPLQVESIIQLPDPRHPRVLAAELDRPPLLSMLIEQLEDALQMIGFRRDGRAFRPHITVGRFKRPPRNRLPLIDLPPSGFLADRLELMESELRPAGPIYTVMASLELPR